MRTLFGLVLLTVAACGSVTSSEGMTDAGGGAGGELGGRGGVGNGPGSGGNSGNGGRAGAGNPGGTGGACVDYVTGSVPGFALNFGCNGEPPATATACHAMCELNGAHFVGCVLNNAYATYCYSSCSACP